MLQPGYTLCRGLDVLYDAVWIYPMPLHDASLLTTMVTWMNSIDTMKKLVNMTKQVKIIEGLSVTTVWALR